MTLKKTKASKPAYKSADKSANKSVKKSAQKPASESANKPTLPEPEVATALVHDLVGGAVIALPVELKEIVGDEAFKDILADFANHVMTVIIRRPGHIIYIDAILNAQELSADRQSEGKA